jgi:hypothetical protein
MTITGKLYGLVFTALWNKEIDYDSDTIAVTLHTSTYTPDQDAHDYFNDATNELGTASGYTAGGKNLASKTVTYTGGTNKHVLDAADLQWTSFSATFRTAVIHDHTPATDATRPLIGYQNSDADITGGGGNLDLVWNASGIVEITVG